MKELRIEPEVFDDLVEAAAWYDEQQPGVGDRFLASMRKLMETIAERPDSFAREEGRIHFAMEKPFPYKIYYANRKSTVRIIAVLHSALHPSTWKSRAHLDDE